MGGVHTKPSVVTTIGFGGPTLYEKKREWEARARERERERERKRERESLKLKRVYVRHQVLGNQPLSP